MDDDISTDSPRKPEKNDFLQDEVKKVLSKEPAIIPQDQIRQDDGPQIHQLNKEVDVLVTDNKLYEEIEKDWEEVQRVFSGKEAELHTFKEKYETIYNALKESYENELKQAKKCKEHNSELVVNTAKTQTTQKMSEDYASTIVIMQQEIQNNMTSIDKSLKKEQALKDKIETIKDEINAINRQMEKGLEDIRIKNERLISDYSRQKNDLIMTQEKNLSKLAELRLKTDYSNKEKNAQEEENFKNLSEINKLKEQIAQIQIEIAKEETRKKDMENQMDLTKKETDEAQEQKGKKEQLIEENAKAIDTWKDQALKKMKEKESCHENVHTEKGRHKAALKEREKQKDLLQHLESHLEEQKEELLKRRKDAADLNKDLEKVYVEHKIYIKKKDEVTILRKQLENDRAHLEEIIKIKEEAYNEAKKSLHVIEDEIDHIFKNREEISRDIKKAEDDDHDLDGQLIAIVNNIKKLENHLKGYKIEAAKINKQINLLEKEQEKYGIDASQAHAKYYQTLEELKIKNNLINELQKKNSEMEAKLKHQQNLYEAVRSDRNLYGKNLHQAHEEIGELTKKFTRMSHQVEQFKDELKLKDAALVNEDREFQKIVKENQKTKIEKDRVKKNIKSTEDVIKNQEEQIARLKYIISEAHSEKSRQQKDYEMVVNERDILGSQLIKRNQELAQLYEKIKIAQSNLAKGESYFRDKQGEFEQLKGNLAQLRKEFENTKEQTKSVDDLKQEIVLLQKDLLNQKTRVRALQDELSVPMNVHRWRKVEATDQENYERILKIQTLQRRLIAKTEEVNEKDVLIKEKEKLYMELKNILARQPGQEIHQQLATYKENLKEKSAQMKNMVGELKEAQEQVNMHKFDIENLKKKIQSMKQEYFKRRAEDDKVRTNQMSNYNPQIQMPYAYQGMNRSGASDGAGLAIGGSGNIVQPQPESN